MKKFAVLLLLIALGYGLQLITGWEIPLVKWIPVATAAVGSLIFTLLATTLSFLNPGDGPRAWWQVGPGPETLEAWQKFWSTTFAAGFAHLVVLGCLLLGVWILLGKNVITWDPLTIKRWKRFRSMRRGYISMWLLLSLVLIALLDNVLVGKRALLVSYEGNLRCPFLESNPIMGKDFGVEPGNSETDYRELKKSFEKAGQGNWVLLPLVPYDARGDTPPVRQIVEQRADQLYYDQDEAEPFTGSAFIPYAAQPDVRRKDLRFRDGKLHGSSTENDLQGTPVVRVEYAAGVETKRTQLNEHDAAALDAVASKTLQRIDYAPTKPSFRHRHFLGTDSSGADVLAMLIGAFQLIIGGALFYCVVTYFIGIVVGGLAGYLGGWTDLLSQRGIEIWSSLPFLYLIILLRSLNERPSMLFVVTVMAAFSWMGIAAYMRTSTFREKNRDYVAAAKLLGASDRRMVFTHILPNTLSVLITLLPFKIDALISGLTALDYLGFGLPVGEPSWGTLLKDGVGNLDKPWILMSGFSALAVILVLVTFIGEAIREAFDPKKFSYYA
jgi:microcin C transport system permease protein